MRKKDNNIWVDKLESCLYDDQVNIITDLRFTNELEWVNNVGGLSVFIKRDGAEPANEYEELNNKEIAEKADLCFHMGNFQDEKLVHLAGNEVLNSLINEEIYKSWKTTCPL